MTNKMSPRDSMTLPATLIPQFRTELAIQGGVEKDLLVRVMGGIGDQICAEPTVRYAIRHFKGCKISLASHYPELFRHLEIEKTFNLHEVRPVYDNFLVFDTLVNEQNLLWQFFSPALTHCVDFASMCAFRAMLPIADREVQLSDEEPGIGVSDILGPEHRAVFVHPGRHWPSKTFPKDWWDAVLKRISDRDCLPVIIGADTDENRSTVDVDTKRCIDLRNQTSVAETVWLLKHARVLLTNDSAPLHMAAAGHAWIGFVATCKHPDYITHWRNGQWGWKMQNWGKGGMWDIIDFCPNKRQEVTVEHIDESTLRTWLPDPCEYADWAVSRLDR